MSVLSQLSNGKLAFLIGLVLFALAGGFIHFVHPGGFEGQLVWGFALLPGILPAQLLGVLADKIPDRIGEILLTLRLSSSTCSGIGWPATAL